MHNFNAAQLGHEAQDDAAPSDDQAHEIRMAWIAALWAMLALTATAIALWDGWLAVP